MIEKKDITDLANKAIEEKEELFGSKLDYVSRSIAILFFFKGFSDGWNKCVEDTDSLILRHLEDIHNLY